jgi:hypothetical protein
MEYSLKDAYIQLHPRNPTDIPETSKKFLMVVLSYLNGMIGAKTNINYNIIPVTRDFIMKFPIFPYSNEEKALPIKKLILSRAYTLASYLKDFRWEKCEKRVLWLVRALELSGIDLESFFTLSTVSPNSDTEPIVKDIKIRKPTLSYQTIEKHIFSDGSIIRYLRDPYLENYGIFQNLSINFDEMGMGYNCLHLYEHLTTKCWKNLSNTDIVEFNGSTYPVGLCFIYTIHSTESSLKKYASALIQFSVNSRDEDFWSNIMTDDIKLETLRTISETRSEKTLASMGRSDHSAYDFNYNTKIFEYWSNKPFDILIATPNTEFEVKYDAIESFISQHKLRQLSRPPNVQFSIPIYDAFKFHHLSKEYTKKVDTNDIKNNALLCKPQHFYGVDCVMTSASNIGQYMSILYPLLFNWKAFEDDLESIFCDVIIPNRCELFNRSLNEMHNVLTE